MSAFAKGVSSISELVSRQNDSDTEEFHESLKDCAYQVSSIADVADQQSTTLKTVDASRSSESITDNEERNG